MKVLVDWPDKCTQKELTSWADDLARIIPSGSDVIRYLHALAAIAPEAPKPAEEVKRWVWADEDGVGCWAMENEPHPDYAALVTFPRKPAPKLREVTLWRYRTSVAQDIYAKSTNWAPYDHDAWERVGTGWVEE